MVTFLLRCSALIRTLLAAVSSALAMWVANAATVSPSADTAAAKAHFTPANLVSTFHRSIKSADDRPGVEADFRGWKIFCAS